MLQKNVLDTDKTFLLLLKLSIPTMVGGFASALYNIVDSIFVGQYVGVNALVALTVSHSIQLGFIACAALFSVGSSVLISRALGAKEESKVNYIIVTTTVYTLCITLVLSSLVVYFLKDILVIIGIEQSAYADSITYITMIAMFAFVVLLNGIFSGMLRAKGYSHLSMHMAILGAVLNIFLDALFIIVVPWGVFGAAFATVLSQCIVMFLSVFYIFKAYKISPFDLRYLEKKSTILIEIIKIGLPSGIRLLVIALSTLMTNKTLAVYGVNAVAAYGIVSRVVSLAFMPVQGCNFGTQPIISFNYGARRFDRVKDTIFKSVFFMCGISGLGTLLFFVAPISWFNIFTDSTDIIKLVKEALSYIGSCFVGFSVYMLLSGVVQSLGYVKESLFLSLSRPLLYMIFLAILPNYFGLQGIWIAVPVSDVVNCIIATIITYKVYKNLNKSQQLKSITPIEGEFSA